MNTVTFTLATDTTEATVTPFVAEVRVLEVPELSAIAGGDVIVSFT